MLSPSAYIYNMNSFINIIRHPLKFRFFLFSKLPAAFFSGVRIVHFDEQKCVTSIPFKWLTQNPFRSTYFASLSMAAELSTGALIMNQLYGRVPAVASLVVKMEANYFKKATHITYFTCEEGNQVKLAVAKTVEQDDPVTITLLSIGKNKANEKIAEFQFTWSLKRRKSNAEINTKN